MINYCVVTNLGCAVDVSEKEFNYFLSQLNMLDPSHSFRKELEERDGLQYVYKYYKLSNGELAGFIIESEDLI